MWNTKLEDIHRFHQGKFIFLRGYSALCRYATVCFEQTRQFGAFEIA